jgi:hypothetical protein
MREEDKRITLGGSVITFVHASVITFVHARPHVRLSTGRPVSQYAGNEGCTG